MEANRARLTWWRFKINALPKNKFEKRWTFERSRWKRERPLIFNFALEAFQSHIHFAGQTRKPSEIDSNPLGSDDSAPVFYKLALEKKSRNRKPAMRSFFISTLRKLIHYFNTAVIASAPEGQACTATSWFIIIPPLVLARTCAGGF